MNTARILSTHIPRYWDIIKYALQKVEDLEGKDTSKYFNTILASLLADKAQCFIISSDTNIAAVGITEIRRNVLDGVSTFYIKALYAFEVVDTDSWGLAMDKVKTFALAQGCQRIDFQTSNARIIKLANAQGAQQDSVNMFISLGG